MCGHGGEREQMHGRGGGIQEAGLIFLRRKTPTQGSELEEWNLLTCARRAVHVRAASVRKARLCLPMTGGGVDGCELP